jgi:hypothetical protein
MRLPPSDIAEMRDLDVALQKLKPGNMAYRSSSWMEISPHGERSWMAMTTMDITKLSVGTLP